ncbi:MAG: N-6 DNA methylase [Methylomonas sp.]|jgi:type I restriction-modification system DNA methylase subunit|uniref:Eco57I restriction-modification methylase domain-containing protein n=1 Tax=Methylomonas sp. TaxID=418 RepID=UPI0025E642BA|nr:N-6 DNA methylase [Methylomonas sp.]MCK9608839.1 N-6 DNA methylase [Methylomonas sp.]
MSFIDSHAEWLSLIEISGPFLAVPVLKEVFPQGLEQLDVDKRKRLRQAYEEWREALENDDPRFPELHQAWIAEVLDRGLELDEDGRGDVLKRSTAIPDKLIIDLPEYGVKLAPDATVVDEQSGNALMLIQTFPVHTDLEATSKRDGWASSPAERMVQLCRQTGCRLGLLTNGERWMLVDAPVGAVTTFASWYARLWGQEPITLQAFVHLLGIRRFFVDDSERLPALFDRSLKHQDEVTEALGEQVRRAVEVLIQALDKADLDRDRALLADVSTAEIYEAALTVMMRLVFLLSAEERGLLLLGDERYETHYALSTLRMQLRADSAEILERRWDAWSRLLALFRAVYGGIEHENLRMPALGGSLFDPDRFPFLEGRDKHSQWRIDPAKPLPIDNRTVLLLLDAIQQFQGRTLSYRALDVEQIGYVYEGLLERTVKPAKDVTLELDATKSAKSPWVTLTELETARKTGDEKLAELLRERSGSSASRIRNDLVKAIDDVLADKLLTACHADVVLRDRVKPYANLLRVDPWGYPLVYPAGSFMVTTGSDRRETGTHYTPKSLTEAIVTETLTPVVYVGPAEGKPREEWQLKSAAELLDLKVCDPAMGSGAFLVQVCRWLAERLVEAWTQAESSGKYVTVDGEVRDAVTGEEPLPRDDEERIVIARRLIAERCLYGVDLNPLAVELAKLSIWLVTLAKGRPFGFLDHNLRCGDSLLGIHRLDQLTELSMTPGRKNTQMRLFGRNIEQAVAEAIELRKRLRQMPIRDIHDVETMARLDKEAKAKLEAPERIADAFIAEIIKTGSNENSLDAALMTLAIEADQYLKGDLISGENIRKRVINGLELKKRYKPFHWTLEFPEVFANKNEGFHAVIGNPPWGSTVDFDHKKWFDFTYQYVGDYETAIAFVELVTRIFKCNGMGGLVLPNTLLLNGSSRKIRDYICHSFRIISISDLTEHEIFRGASVRCCVLTFQANQNTSKSFYYSRSLDCHIGDSIKLDQDKLLSRPHWANIDSSEVIIPSGALTIEDLFFVKQGYKPYDKHALLKRMAESEAKRIVSEKPWHAEQKLDETYVPELRGKDVSRYKVTWSGLWASYGPWVSNYLDPSWFNDKRVLVREIVDKPPRLIIASQFKEYSVHNPSIICIKPKSKGNEILLGFLELYLNSCLASEFISFISSKSSKGMFPKVLVKELKELPFPPPEVLNESVILRADELLSKVRNSENPELIDNFVEEIFSSIPPLPSLGTLGQKAFSSNVTKVKTKQKLSKKKFHDRQLSFDFFTIPSEFKTSTTNQKTGNQWGSIASDQILAWLEAHKSWFTKSAILNGCGADPNEWLSAIDELLKDEYIESQGEPDAVRYRAKP